MDAKMTGARGGAGEVVLALDTSSDMLACVGARCMPRLGPGAHVEVLATGDHQCRRRSNVELVSTCARVLEEAGLTFADVGTVLTGRGPGSFTGVRIGVATAKGLACGLGVALRGASVLDAVAWRAWLAGERGLLGVVADAMRGEVYPGIYRLDETGAHRTFATETVVKADACVDQWASYATGATGATGGLTLVGNGLVRYRDRFEDAGFASFAPEELWFPSGEGLVAAACARDAVAVAGDGDPALVLPVYTRLSDAEENERKWLGLDAPTSAAAAVTGVDDELAGRHLQLRPMGVNDLDAVADLEVRAYVGAAHTPWTRQMFYEELSQPGRSWWVAHDQGTVVAFAGGTVAGSAIEVSDVVVADGRRREGIASRLLARVAYDGQMLGALKIALEVEEGNAPARALYGRLGLAQVGRRPNYYGPGSDALLLEAALPLVVEGEGLAAEGLDAVPERSWPPAREAFLGEDRDEDVRRRVEEAGPLVLAIESSCDETAMAVLDGRGAVLSSVVATQIDFHARFGGVVPEIASRKHTEAVVGVFEQTMAEAGAALGCATLVPGDLAVVGVTAGPGLVGALVVGVAFAKGLCAATGAPLVAVHHLEGHLLANLFETPDLEPPFVASLVSGGNTLLVHVRAWGDYEVLGETIDDAVGEAFDKVAKALGLGYPGGPVISRLAAEGNPRAIRFPRAMLHSGDYRFSLSGLKTSVITYIQGEERAGRAINLPDLAASFEAAVIDVQVAKAVTAVDETGVRDFCVGGGVAANPQLREAYRRAFEKRGVRVTVPPLAVCGDNAAMIGLEALRNYRAGVTADLTLDADPNAPLGTWTSAEAPVVAGRWP